MSNDVEDSMETMRRLVQARLNFSHLEQSIQRCAEDDEFDPFDADKNPVPTLADLSSERTLN